MLRKERLRKRDHFAPSGEKVESQYTGTFVRKNYAEVLDSIQLGLMPHTLTSL